MVAEGSVGCSVVNWSLSVVFRSNVVGRSSRCVVIRARVVLRRFGVAFDRVGGVISWSIGVVAGNRVVLRFLGGVVLRCRGGVVLRYLGGVTRGRVIFWGFGVVV
jgi:hypothetical protein